MLGFIVAPLGQEVAGQYPNEINYAIGGNGQYLCPPDPQFNTRGEVGFYYDTPLGGLGTETQEYSSLQAMIAAIGRVLSPAQKRMAMRRAQAAQRGALHGGIPTDVELATVYGYTPFVSGWVNAKEGYFPAPWRPPGGWNPAGKYGPQVSLRGASVGTGISYGIIALAAIGTFAAGRYLYKKVTR